MELSSKEVAARFDVEQRTVRYWCERGYLAGARILGKTWLIPDSALEGFQPPPAGWKKGKARKKQEAQDG